MNTTTVTIIDPCRTIVATAQVASTGERFSGWIDLHAMPADLRQMFEEYEEAVTGQMFSFLDEIEAQIENKRLTVLFEEKDEFFVEDLQIYPDAKRVSFKLAQEFEQRFLASPEFYEERLGEKLQA